VWNGRGPGDVGSNRSNVVELTDAEMGCAIDRWPARPVLSSLFR
jgi:hypothetical protein